MCVTICCLAGSTNGEAMLVDIRLVTRSGRVRPALLEGFV